MDKRSKYKLAAVAAVVLIIAAIAGYANKGEIKKGTGSSETKGGYQVTFYSDTDEPLKVEEVEDGMAAEPPVDPSVSYGNVFIKWDKDFSEVKSDMDIHPVCESFLGEKNVFALSGVYASSDGTAYTSLKLCGDVCLAGFELTLEYDSEKLNLENVFDEDGDLVCNLEEPGKIIMNLASASNVEGEIDLCSFKFHVKDIGSEIPLEIHVGKAVRLEEDDSMTSPDVKVIDASVYSIAGGGDA